MKVRFGPAGRPLDYKGPTEGIPYYLRTVENLDAFEYQAVRGVRIKQNRAQLLGEEASKYDIRLSLHAPYAINFSSKKPSIIEASKKRLLQSVIAASWMNAKVVVFHPGYYGDLSPNKAVNTCIKALREVVEEIKALGIKAPLLGPETMGKLSQLGSLTEIILICQEVDMCIPVIDWAHIHARERGYLRDKDSFLKVINQIEKELGSDIAKNLHTHFTKVEFSDKGERKHRTLDELKYGPDFKPLAELIVEQDLYMTIISESPLLDKDAIKMKNIFKDIINTFKRKEQYQIR